MQANLSSLRCPKCVSKGKEGLLLFHEDKLCCKEQSCDSFFPIVDGLPILVTKDGDYYKIRDHYLCDQTNEG